jgi:hypothetical protein
VALLADELRAPQADLQNLWIMPQKEEVQNDFYVQQ